MRISIVSRRNATRDPAIRALLFSLRAAGHDVTLICTGVIESGLPEGIDVRIVEADKARGLWGRITRRLGAGAWNRHLDEALGATLEEANPDVVYPHRADDIELADSVGAPVLRRPEWPAARNDLILLAPQSPDVAGLDLMPIEPDEPSLLPGRHGGTSVVIAYRVTPTNPGRYLESALRRSGASVTVLDGELDWNRVPDDAACVVVVESPYPLMDVRGTKRDVPVLFWAHHGEHHLPANLRLTHRYQADAVLMAHSWHLAHRFPVPVHRFPFAVAPELFGEPRPWTERTYDVAMVGAGIGSSGGRYTTRRRIAAALESDEDIRTRFAYGLTPEEMVALYGDARIVINDGGPRHFPITMRVFETLGAGALLLTEDIPGTDTLLIPDEHYVVMVDDIGTQMHTLLSTDSSARVAGAGHDWALRRHTYDHRVDQLFNIARRTHPEIQPRLEPAGMTPLAELVDQDVDAQHVAVFGDVDPLGLDDRAVRVGDGKGLREKSIDAVVIGSGTVDDLTKAVLAARGYVYAELAHSEEVRDILATHHPEARVSTESDLLRADLGGSGYRMRPADHPLAR